MLFCSQVSKAFPRSVAVAILTCSFAGFTLEQKRPATLPLEADLVGALDASRLKEGAAVTARVVEAWHGADCYLALGAQLHGHVLQVVRHSKLEKGSSFQVLFNSAPCNGTAAIRYELTLISMIGPFGDQPRADGLMEAPPLADAPGIQVGVAVGTREAQARDGGASMRSVSGASYVNEYTQEVRRMRKLPTQIVPGQVIDVPKTDLHVGTGVDGASVISVSKGDARLEAMTTMLFVPSSALKGVQHEVKELLSKEHGPGVPSSPGAGGVSGVAIAAPAPSIAAAPDVPDETAICDGTCNVLGSFGSRGEQESRAASMLPISVLGYAPHESSARCLLTTRLR